MREVSGGVKGKDDETDRPKGGGPKAQPHYDHDTSLVLSRHVPPMRVICNLHRQTC
ncbi:hypothetical protein F2Q70_00006998 [Brassica cretica]|uniref:Uncharacterized protein n=1 Tax=Brassica cretica TaxID=69181 RepID=A0A8S9M2H1_BRACR|nr:hypothetical protein F2Q70_00006998 [Brassica cretica]